VSSKYEYDYEYEPEPNVYETRLRRWLAEYPYPFPTSDQLSSSGFTPEEVAAALAEAYACHTGRPHDPADDYAGGTDEVFVIWERVD
jgi:hypothetical protein